ITEHHALHPRPTLFPSTTLFRSEGKRFHEKALGGWKISGIDQFQSGPWLTPSISTATASRRPDRVGAPKYLDPRNVVTLTGGDGDRKSTRLNSSHRTISYAVFCL